MHKKLLWTAELLGFKPNNKPRIKADIINYGTTLSGAGSSITQGRKGPRIEFGNSKMGSFDKDR